ncbi:MAG: hypothetical protein KIT84_15395 [Labilithrix sp.]|nr:hypothetical protein [Labilithrix sp.]MCW5812410.1 hypothetical protein [Labilithrix sp.]
MKAPLRVLGFLPVLAALAAGCADDPASDPKSASSEATGEIVLSAKAEPLSSFSFDTGLVPSGSPAQVQLKLAAGGGVSVIAIGTPSANGLDGKKGSGKLAVNVHVKLDGKLKVESPLKTIDEDLPGLEDIDIAIKGEAAFDPFLVGENESARVEARIPAADLPEIPLGATPGKLRLSVVEGSVLRSTFKGSCIGVASEMASYRGELATSGNLILKGTLVVELGGMFDKEVELGEIAVPIPAATTPLAFGEKPAAGAADDQSGAKCGAPKTGAPRTDGKATTDTSGKACLGITCEDVGGACGDHDDGCGNKFNCGACEEPGSICTPTTCERLGKTCGVHANGCGGTVSCGTCPTTCATDEREPNNSYRDATSLGAGNDWDGYDRTIAKLEASDGDEDWFSLYVADRGLNGNPTITATSTDRKLEVAIFHVCDSLPNYSYCNGSGTVESSPGRGCISTGTVSLNTDCSGTDESGTTYVRVRKSASDGTCHSYDLTVSVK